MLDFFHIELYDNKPGKSDRIGLGLDKLDYLIQLRPNLETLKPCFKEESATHNVRMLRQSVPIPPAGGNFYPYLAMPPPPSQYRVVERIPFSNQTNVQPTKRPARRDANPESPKKPRKLGLLNVRIFRLLVIKNHLRTFHQKYLMIFSILL